MNMPLTRAGEYSSIRANKTTGNQKKLKSKYTNDTFCMSNNIWHHVYSLKDTVQQVFAMTTCTLLQPLGANELVDAGAPDYI